MYVKEYCCTGNDCSQCWAGPASPTDDSSHGPPLSQADFIQHTAVFDLNMEPYDGQETLGPWQTMTAVKQTDSINVRIAEAVGYVESCCMNGDITVDVENESAKLWCTGPDRGNCQNEVDGSCTNPFFPHSDTYPVSTIQKSSLTPPLTWCGCTKEGTATVGYSGRCSHKMESFYTRYESLAQAVCGA